MKNKVSKVAVIVMVLSIVWGICGCANNLQTKKQGNNNHETSNEKQNPQVDSQPEITGDNLINSADLSGSVTEVMKDGCMLEQTMLEGEELAYESAEGNNSENQVKVIYAEEVEFQSATIEIDSGRVVKLTDISKDDIKKQSRVLLFGDFQDTYTFKATKVVSYYLQ